MSPGIQGLSKFFIYSTDDELKYATEEWLKEQSELFYFTGIEKHRQRYKFCIDKGGDYVEK